MHAPLITLLTDFGTKDAYVAQMKGQILSICPQARLIDITHDLPAQDIAYGALVLAQATPFFPATTVHVAVVDPGVGTPRSLLAVEIDTTTEPGECPRRQRFVLPDNGLIGLLTDRFGIVAAHRLTVESYWRSSISATFHGRDILGPVAAHWASGCAPESFGPACTPATSKIWRNPTVTSSQITGEVAAIDHFGNIISNIPQNHLTAIGSDTVELSVGEQHYRLPIVRTYGNGQAGETILLVGSHGLLEIAVVGGNAAKIHTIERGSPIRIVLSRDLVD